MKTFKIKSLDPNLTDDQLKHQGCQTTSFLSFERAIKETTGMGNKEIKGYKVTEDGIEIIWH